MKVTNLLILMCVAFSLSAQNAIQWRNDRTGIYNEKNLLKSWPEEGPQLLWHYDDLGEGHSSIAVDADKIYVTGMTENVGYLYVFDLNGKLLDKKNYGSEWAKNYNGPRGTITINDGKLYLFTGTGHLICMNQNSLEILWKKDIEADFGGKNIMWGVNESPLVVNEKVILSVGGKEHNIVALNKNDGSLIWSSPGEGDPTAYCSPLYIGDVEVPQITTTMAGHILGIDAATGEKLWSHPYKSQRSIHPNTPIYNDNMLLFSNGYGIGSVMFRLINGGRNIEKVWESTDLEPKTGGIVKIGNYVYGSGDQRKFWYCLDWNTGETKYKDNTFGTGVTIANNGMLYCYSEKGEMALVKATPEKFDLVSKFPITLGTDQHWAHPVIYKGVLYVRHGNTLMAYQIK
ncbi:MAG: PQQ-binding-like beta-propeller repeat protein [Dysgonamonadaceae bacterium]|jgi:outer membrane protein assembly factor BamB|nr:PQQ-binding-like beta-propeller repeat protein [Dysgonamonadaceae bacterium]